MNMNHETKLIKVSQLLINVENPRFEKVENLQEAIKLMIENQNDKLAKLAEDIIENGLNPSDLIIVIPSDNSGDKYIILEGNRRLTAVKLLANPSFIPDAYKTLQNKFLALSEIYLNNSSCDK